MNTLSRSASVTVAGLCRLGATASAAPDGLSASMDAAMAQPGTGNPDFDPIMIPHGPRH